MPDLEPSPAASADVWQVTARDREWLFRLFFLGAFGYLIYQSLRILAPFATALTAALIITLVFFPAHAGLLRLVRRRNLAAAATTVLALIVVIVPFLVLGWLLLDEAAAVFPHVRDLIAQPLADGNPAFDLPPLLARSWERIQQFVARWDIDVRDIALESVRQLGNNLTAFGTGVLKNSVLVVFDIVVLVVAIFFFFRDGSVIVRGVVDLIPMETDDKQMIIDRLDQTLSAIVRSAFITATVQGLLAGVGFAVAGVSFPVLLGFATALLAVVPIAGAGIVWAPVGLYLIFSGAVSAGVGVLLWGATAVSMSDNLLRTFLISGRTQLSLLLLFPGILGGIQVYGIAGALIGPLVIATLLAFVRIYHEQYHSTSHAERSVAT
jgi:predicted PurR-regulated permease PerM